MSVERGYRDSRINRIFEGTNEINRLLVVDTAMKRAMKGDFDLFTPAEKLYENISDQLQTVSVDESDFIQKSGYLRNLKKIALLAIHGASKYFNKKLIQEQEVLNNISEIIIEIYIAESLLLRVQKLENMRGIDTTSVYRSLMDVYIYDAADKIRKSAHDAFNSFGDEEQAAKMNQSIDLLSKIPGVNVKEARRKIADKLIDDNMYKF